MSDSRLTRRGFIRNTAVTAAGVVAAVDAATAAKKRPVADAKAIRKTRSYNPQMAYRRLGKTGAWVSAVSLGGHWKRVDKVLGSVKPQGGRSAFNQNRWDVVTRCLEVGINYIDACSGQEILAYAKAVKGRREKVFFGYSWHLREPRFKEWRTAKRLLAGLDQGLREAGLEYCDFWRISAIMRGGGHSQADEEEMIRALETARKQGKSRFTGLSSHDRPWLKKMVEQYPDVVQAILTPYTANSKELPKDSLFDSVRKHDVGVFGIKPFASNSLFSGDGSPDSPHAAADDRRARLAIRYILSNPAITAPIPGLISIHQVDNMVAALKERRTLDVAETAELQQAAQQMWANLPQGYQWLKQWQYV